MEFIECPLCGSKEGAVKRWNTRADDWQQKYAELWAAVNNYMSRRPFEQTWEEWDRLRDFYRNNPPKGE